MQQTVEEAIVAIFAEVLELEEDEVTIDFKKEEDDEWDSVNSLRLFTNIEEELGVKLDMNQFMNTTSIREVIRVVEAAKK